MSQHPPAPSRIIRRRPSTVPTVRKPSLAGASPAIPPLFRPERRSTSAYRDGEVKLYGLNLCKTVWARRPDDVVKIYVARTMADYFQRLLTAVAARRKAFKLVENDELERLTQSVHHEGVCFIVKNKPAVTGETLLAQLMRCATPTCVLALDGVHNPHNVGTILRTSAHFGVESVLLGNVESGVLPPSARRVSEGGCEFVTTAVYSELSVAIKSLREAGWRIVGASAHADKSLFGANLGQRCVLVLGNEISGLTPAVAGACDELAAIPGTGQVESLNVSVAAALLLAEYFRVR